LAASWKRAPGIHGEASVIGKAAVYAAGTDYRFKTLRLYSSSEEFATLPDFGGVPVGNQWRNHRAVIANETEGLPAPDIWGVLGQSYTFAASADVLERLEPFISEAAELLPLDSQEAAGERLFALNVLDPLDLYAVIDTTAGEEERMRELEQDSALVGDVLTQEEYEAILESARKGEVFPVLYPAFIEDELPTSATFFKIDQFLGDIFLLDREDDPDTLLRRVDEFGLTGMALTKLWSTESGAEHLNLFRDV
jgi:hypothetical protein